LNYAHLAFSYNSAIYLGGTISSFIEKIKSIGYGIYPILDLLFHLLLIKNLKKNKYFGPKDKNISSIEVNEFSIINP